MVLAEMGMLAARIPKTSMMVIDECRKIVGLSLDNQNVIGPKLIARMAPDDRRALASISRNPIIRDHLISRTTESLSHHRMVHRHRVDFALR
jgi:hypothetical protein